MIALFPGQGSQHVGMAKDLFDNFAVARETFEEASDAIKVDLKKLCFDGPESDLTLTQNTQPCLLVASIAAYRVTKAEKDFQPKLFAGHSLGEYSALVAADAIPLAAATRWVRQRGQEMQQAVPQGQGTMAAVMNLEDDQVEKFCQEARTKTNEVVEPANYNSPGQVVVAGSTQAVSTVVELVKGSGQKRAKAVPLAVSAPFHCEMMAPARDAMAKVFMTADTAEKPSKIAAPYIPNRTARVTGEPGVILDFLVEQIDNPVLWKQSMIAAMDAGVTTGVEFGPGKVLQGLGKRIAKAAERTLELTGVNSIDTLKAFTDK